MMTSCRKTVTPLSLFQSMDNFEPDSGRSVCKTYIFINSNSSILEKLKTELKIFNTAPTLSLSVKVLFLPKRANFLQKNADISKIKTVLVLKGIFSETAYVCVLTHHTSSF